MNNFKINKKELEECKQICKLIKEKTAIDNVSFTMLHCGYFIKNHGDYFEIIKRNENENEFGIIFLDFNTLENINTRKNQQSEDKING